MKLSQFIKLLQRLEYEHGDIPVVNLAEKAAKAEFTVLEETRKAILIR